MGQKTITVRGRTFAVESKSGSQTAYIIREFEKRTDAQLDSYAAESESDRDALISAIGFYSSPDDSELSPETAAQYRADRAEDDRL